MPEGISARFLEIVNKDLPPNVYTDGDPLEMYVAYADQIPVVTGLLVLEANVAGIYYIATVPSHRKKRLWNGMMEHLISRAKKEGYHIALFSGTVRPNFGHGWPPYCPV